MELKRFRFSSVWPDRIPCERAGLSVKIVWLCTGVFVGLHILDWTHVLAWEQAISWLGISRSSLLDNHRFYQFVTAPLVHGGVLHLAFNMLALLMLGPSLEHAMGRHRYVTLSAVSAMGGVIGFLLTTPHPFVFTMGYSGAMFGILVAQAQYFPDQRLLIFGVFPMKMKHAVFILGAIEFYLTITPEGGRGLAHAAHLFGAVFAFVYLRVLVGLEKRAITTAGAQHRAATHRNPRPKRARTEIPREL